jgi:hypothetical protein
MTEDDYSIENLILSGVLEPSGIDLDTGEVVYNFTEALKDHDPKLYTEFQNYFSEEVASLWSKGFVDMNITEKNPTVRLTNKAFDLDAVSSLSKSNQYSLKEIKRLLDNTRLDL